MADPDNHRNFLPWEEVYIPLDGYYTSRQLYHDSFPDIFWVARV